MKTLSSDGQLFRGWMLGKGLDISQAAGVIGWSRNKVSRMVNNGQEITLPDALEAAEKIAEWKARQVQGTRQTTIKA